MDAKNSLLITVKKVKKELILDRIQIKCITQNKKVPISTKQNTASLLTVLKMMMTICLVHPRENKNRLLPKDTSVNDKH